MSRSKPTRRTAFAMAVILAVPTAVQLAAATPALAVPPGLVRTVSTDDSYHSNPYQRTFASCPAGMNVIGGGAIIYGGGDQVRLVGLWPFRPPTGAPDVYEAEAEEPDSGYAGSWRLEAYAICASPARSRGYEIETAQTPESSSAFQITAAGCPGDKRVIGTGAEVVHSNGQVGLQLTRPDGPLRIARATAREDANGYAQSLIAYAICADRIESAAVYGTLGQEGGAASCPPDKFVHSVGGGGSLFDSGPYFLRQVYPSSTLTSFSVYMAGPPIGGTAVGAICAY